MISKSLKKFLVNMINCLRICWIFILWIIRQKRSFLLKQSVQTNCQTTKDRKELMSIILTKWICRLLKRPPLKLKLIKLYHSIYESLLGPWATVVGSYAEGLSLNSSDMDFMLDTLEIYNSSDDIPPTSNQGLEIFTDDESIPPGCCWLRSYDNSGYGSFIPSYKPALACCRTWFGNFIPSYRPTLACCRIWLLRRIVDDVEYKLVDRNGYKYLSSRDVWKNHELQGFSIFATLNRILPRWTAHGPAYKQTYFGKFEIDIVEAFRCRTLPSIFQKWADRKRNEWPPTKAIQQALQKGCHVLCIPSHVSSEVDQEIEFRISYGEVGQVLTESLNESQKHCYILLKIIIKEYVEPHFPDEDFISSFILKTVVYWLAEETEGKIWTPPNLLNCLDLALGKLGQWIESGYCPNYFIKEYNLFRTKLKRMRNLDFAHWFNEKVVKKKWKVLFRCKSFEYLKDCKL